MYRRAKNPILSRNDTNNFGRFSCATKKKKSKSKRKSVLNEIEKKTHDTI